MGDVSPTRVSGLKRDCLSFLEILSQSVANISPTITPVMIVPLVFASAGNGTWVAYLFATLGLVAVGLNINQFARRSGTPGSLYSYIALGLGINLGVVAGWSLIAAYLFTAMSVLAAFVNYALILLGWLNIGVPPVVLFALVALAAWYVAYTDIKFSTRLMLGSEISSMLLILILGGIVFAHRGRLVDTKQFQFRAMDFTGLKAGLILAVFSFVGFESATTLGEEGRRPLINIPRAVISSALIAGFFFMLTAYIAVLGFRGLAHPLGSSNAPFNELAHDAGVGFFGVLISAGAVVSAFACTLASVNASARIIFSMGRVGVLPSGLGRAHPAHETPHHSATLSAVLAFLVPATLVACGLPIMDIFNDLGTIATYGFLIAYALISTAAVAYLRRLGKMTARSVAVAGISLVFLAPAFVSAVYPAPPPPLNWLPYAFLGYLAVGTLWFALRHSRSARLADGIKGELAALHARFSDQVAE